MSTENDPVNKASVEYLLEELEKAEAKILALEEKVACQEREKYKSPWSQGYPSQSITWASGSSSMNALWAGDTNTPSNHASNTHITLHSAAEDAYKLYESRILDTQSVMKLNGDIA